MGKHKEWRKLAKKARRKRIRQTAARYKHDKDEEERVHRERSPRYHRLLKNYEEEEAFQEQEEARLRRQAEQRWLRIEAEAQRQWCELQKKLQEAREERARQNLLIKLEWEKEQQRLKELKEAKEREREENERTEKLLQEEIEDFLEHGGSTPEHLKVDSESNPAQKTCPFFEKTGACRFRESCSRNHIKPRVSRTILIPNFFSHYSLEQTDTEHGDSSLEFESHETYAHFKEFFFDVAPEMETCGAIRQFRVCCNHEAHLRGNVYVEYAATRDALKSFRTFNGRWYGGKQLSVEFCRVESWKAAICGLHGRKRCPKGNACNFLHVFRNPRRLFQPDERDEHRTPARRPESEERNWRWSESPERFPSSPSKSDGVRNGNRRRRSRSRSGDRKSSRRRKNRHSTSDRRRENGTKKNYKHR